jgi:RNA polymerase sigma factor for flagellar operon FliA
MKHDRGRPAVAGADDERSHTSAYVVSEDVSAAERDRLILENLPQVRLIARRIHDKLPESVSLDDLISTGVVGLITAIDNFDASQNVKLKTYAEYKIRGAILDSLRGLDWAPRQQRKRSKQIEAAIAEVEHRLHRIPTEDEVADQLSLSLTSIMRAGRNPRREYRKPRICGGDEEGRDMLQFVSDRKKIWPSALFERAELENCLPRLSRRCPKWSAPGLLYYHKELTLREIATVMDLHESRVSQLKSQAVLRLRTYMERRWPMTTAIGPELAIGRHPVADRRMDGQIGQLGRDDDRGASGLKMGSSDQPTLRKFRRRFGIAFRSVLGRCGRLHRRRGRYLGPHGQVRAGGGGSCGRFPGRCAQRLSRDPYTGHIRVSEVNRRAIG